MAATVLWFRRDLRLGDHPALVAAAAEGRVVPLFVVDPVLWGTSGPVRQISLLRSLRSLGARTGGLVVRSGDPLAAVVDAARTADAREVHVSADHAPYGHARDRRVEEALAQHGIALVRTGSPYAVAPGRLLKGDGTPFRVYSAYFRAWTAHGWRAPAAPSPDVEWLHLPVTDSLPDEPVVDRLTLPDAGEDAARECWRRFRDAHLPGYATGRDRPDLDATSQLSAHLRWGEIHPRTVLADLESLSGRGVDAYRRELAWREFYADVLSHNPWSARESLRQDLRAMELDTGPVADARYEAWCAGLTGYPFVDAGMRQLRSVGWMHNRVRMVVASFLVKDLHLHWRRGARHFARWLRDGDLASNVHGWQWVAGTGTDPAPFFRVFNPVSQGRRHDPEGDYVRRWVPELRGVDGGAVHEPWSLPGGPPTGYPPPVVDHAAERAEALRRYEAVRR